MAAHSTRRPRRRAAPCAACLTHSMWIGEKGLDELIVEDGVDPYRAQAQAARRRRRDRRAARRRRRQADELPGRARRAVHAARRAGKLQADEWTHDESVTMQAIVNAVRAAVIEGGA